MTIQKQVQIGDSLFEWGTQTYIMGIVNVTPDSFSGDGLLQNQNWLDRAVAQGIQQESEGAHIIDVGGESTRPGSVPLSLEDEITRVIPVITALARKVKIPISIDTYKSEVAERAIEVGASMVNDVRGLKADANMAAVVAHHRVPIIVMHNRSKLKDATHESELGGRYVSAEYTDLVRDISRELMESVDMARLAGVSDEMIIIDPGIGFGKTTEQNLELVYRWKEFEKLGFPILAGPSRKSFVGYTLGLPPAERLEGTAAAVTLVIERGADIVRVHDVQAMKRVAVFTDAVIRRK